MLESLEKMAADPILGLTAAYNQDQNPNKVDLGAGVYKDENGNTPVFAAIKNAETVWQQEETTKAYIAQSGFADFNSSMIKHIFGESHAAVKNERLKSVMAPGGSGSLRVGAEMLNRANEGAALWVSTPTWGNHIPLLGSTGLQIQEYPYYDSDTHGLLFDAMMESLKNAGRGDIVLLHGCCHNPTGVDLSKTQWDAVADLAQQNGFLPFVDTAYHGLGEGLEEDSYGIRKMADSVDEMLIAYSCSKNFGLYRERTGAIIVLGKNTEAAEASSSHITNIARQMYSLPPAYGAALVKIILQDAKLYQNWKLELDEMRERINGLRVTFADALNERGAGTDFSFIKNQYGMFSFLGISKEQIQRLRDEYSIYLVGSSRINVAGISQKNIAYLSDAIVSVL
ncbi:MAG: aminotransferase class I/II-fold pyridoxal phosphate-dependent enzyme [Gammaproteobacteria bacterium]|nr:aminotransferase class I/II-fold pyridoxal phosphate-dependent enzyme [Gammaproteobacteria bacterium]